MTPIFDGPCDLAVIGAGPAGMAAARVAAEAGARVVLLDEQPAPGGQIYRAITTGGAGRGGVLGSDYLAGAELARGLDHPDIHHVVGATVWRVDAGREIAFSMESAAHLLHARRIVLATGAIERPFPFPGWTLPGVMTAGAAQILLKSAGVVARDAVLAGSGPLLYLIAHQMIAAGAPPAALVETRPEGGLGAAFRHLPGALRDDPGFLSQGCRDRIHAPVKDLLHCLHCHRHQMELGTFSHVESPDTRSRVLLIINQA